MIDWNIQARAHACQACNRHFKEKEAFHTLLFDHKSGYERMDVCEQCWKDQFGQGATERKGFVSHWVSIYTPPPAAPPEAIQKESAETLLRKLVEANDPTHAGARFILAVMLERKRILKVKAQLLQNKQRVFVYEHARTGDLFTIPDPALRLDELEEVQRDVGNLLEHGLGTPEPELPLAPASPSEAKPEPANAHESPDGPMADAEPAIAPEAKLN